MDYPDGEVIFGKGTQVRYSVLTGGSTTRPSAANAFKVLTGVTTSELKGGQDTKDIPGDYETTEGDWKDSKPGSRSWGFSLSANKKASDPQAAMFQELWDAWAAGGYVWVERLLPNDDQWRGGLAFIADPTEPAPWDGAVTFSCSFTGKRALTKTAVST